MIKLEDIIENELDFHGYGTAKIEIEQQSDDINPFTCELHQTLFNIQEFNPALKVINITLAYQNDKNDIAFGVVETKDELQFLMTSARKHSAPKKKSDNRFFKTPRLSFAESILNKVALIEFCCRGSKIRDLIQNL